MTLVECLGHRYSVQSIRLAPGRSQENFIVTWDHANMSRFRPIPPHAEVVEFSLKKTSRGKYNNRKFWIEHLHPEGDNPQPQQGKDNESKTRTCQASISQRMLLSMLIHHRDRDMSVLN